MSESKPKRERPKAGPTRVYAYGAKAPTLNANLVHEQHRLMHRYHNRLIEIERNRRAEAEKIVATAYPRLSELDGQVAEMETEIESLLKAKRAANSEARSKRGAMPPEAVARIKTVKAERKGLYAERKGLRAAAFANPTVRASLAALDAATLAATKQARAESGLYWGNYLFIEDSMRGCRTGAPPRFQRWTGDGAVQVQIQGGIYSDALEANTLLQLIPARGHALAVKRTGGREGSLGIGWREYHIARFRIGSTDAGRPIWAEFPVRCHRALPDDAKIQRAVVTMRRRGNHREWRLLLTITNPDGFPRLDSASDGCVGIDLGWRVVPGGLRVAYCVGDDGEHNELILPDRVVERWAKAEVIQSERDIRFNEAREELAAWMDSRRKDLPEWFVERTKFLSQWRSPSKLASLYWLWDCGEEGSRLKRHKDNTSAINRFPGDDAAHDALSAWRKYDALAWDKQASIVEGAVAARLDIYRVFAAKLRRRYATAVIEKFNIRAMMEKPDADKDDGRNDAAAVYGRIAAIGVLRTCIKQSLAKIVERDAKNTTLMCHACGHVNSFNAAVSIAQTCESCGKTWDQDENSARNLLASGEVASETPEPCEV